ncbi:glycosyl hydrolase family 61-domain-containing protein [Chiua virens]|nr:glycosyl hydrolase family 61-domain-containing protein [Chiua virens]
MTHLFFILLVAGLLPILVSAHGYIGSVTIDGKTYSGNQPGGTTNPSIIRQVSTISPVKGASNPSINCGMNATLASDVGNANPGSQLQVWWVGGATGDSNWPHNVGPVMTYMTKCSGSCSSYDSTNAEWFKISELGTEPNNSTWYQANVVSKQPANVTIPSNIAPGNYLLRSELISLQNAMAEGGAEFYPGCIQLSIGGSGTGAAKSSEECVFPGCYSDSDPGIYDPTVYDPPIDYVFPGPSVAAFVGSGASTGGTQPSGSAGGSSGSSVAPTPTAGSSAPTSSPSGVSTNASSPSSSPTVTPVPTTTPSAIVPANSTTTTPATVCYVTSGKQLLSKRVETKKGMHKRRLLRRAT